MDRTNPFSADPRPSARDRERSLRGQPIRQSWPLLVMIPVLLSVVYASAWAVMIELLLGESFGLSNGRPAPWPGDIAVLFVVSFWLNRMIGGLKVGNAAAQLITAALWIASWLAWVALEPVYDGARIWREPSELVKSDGYLIPPLLISMVMWWLGMTYAATIASISAEDVRLVVQRAWIVAFGSILLAAMVDGSAGDAGLRVARIAVPVQLVASLALVAGAEVESTRRLAVYRGAQPPGWGRWVRLVGGLAIGVGLLTLFVLGVFGTETLDAIVAGLVWVLRAIGVVLAYILFAVVWALYQILSLFVGLLETLFGDMFGPIEAPQVPQSVQPDMSPMEIPEGEGGSWRYAILLRWGLLGLVVLVAVLIFFRMRRGGQDGEGEDLFDEQRDSVFSTDLAKQQLRDLFRRRHRPSRPRRLDLTQPPGSVREMMLYLETLAARQQAGRREPESVTDFTGRLRAVWPGLGKPLIDTAHRYEYVRYGDAPDPPDAATAEQVRRDWEVIWQRRKDWQPPEDPPAD